ncbi:MAG TPA: hypothetical protein VEY51_01685 [Chondromyces sp.]|nr:hypothetical protein [Chondromyces sp.]
MRKTLLLSSLLLLSFFSFGQSNLTKPYYLKLSGGRVAFGTGDILGPSVNIEGAKDLLKQPKKGVNRLLLGTELSFETGVRNVVAINPTVEEFLRSFYHVSNLLLYPKLTYYPFGGIVKGFNVAIGPSFGYSFLSKESGWSGRTTPSGDYIRYSILTANNTWLLGYRISTGYEIGITKKLLTGIRLDFSSYSNGDINTLAALKAGVRW